MNDPGIVMLCAFGLVIGLLPATIAQRKGRNFWLWWAFGAGFFLFALIGAILLSPEPKVAAVPLKVPTELDGKKCPYCAEIIKREAVVCRYCGRDLPPAGQPSGSVASYDRDLLTQRQQSILAEYGYFLSKEDAEEVGVMVDSFASREKIADFVKHNGRPVQK